MKITNAQKGASEKAKNGTWNIFENKTYFNFWLKILICRLTSEWLLKKTQLKTDTIIDY